MLLHVEDPSVSLNQVMRSKRKWSEAEPIPGASGDYHKRFLCPHDWSKSN
ncbi:hypothetical protein Pcac1_g14743 [Phytophthora cactorum]|uniref:Uncharacterized protein n=1 Tax=Phytophthora cactorum TaxID=29920 RepID=A0A8T1A7P3_9STRA|nr:hypothetical protein Pcac1_g14743 [Phytophthora cactorum]KAG2860481.1 hypothetical protein PC114_g28315 [Phytophthora cactorum]KAG2871886.1 hypothetical protein PC117_g28144 [Phytophthora cactorum]KAG2969126.1 hypothetical protein PC119_g24023 [Phytophthora cactorum]